MRILVVAIFALLSSLPLQGAMARDAKLLPPVFAKVQQENFGKSQKEVSLETHVVAKPGKPPANAAAPSPLPNALAMDGIASMNQAAERQGEPAIITVPFSLSEFPASLNYLFDAGGRLYNLAWLVTIPAEKIQAAMSLDTRMMQELSARYSRPVYTFSDGSPGGYATEKAKEMTGPVVFYSRLDFWDAEPLWAYTNLLCSTDGKCLLHLQFVSKKLTAKEKYWPTPDVLFSYSPLDRDQDRVAANNPVVPAK